MLGAWGASPDRSAPDRRATLTGLALASQRLQEERFHVACIGEGASSSGEFWEALNFAGARGLPITYVLQNNQIALDTPATHQSNVEVWADKGVAMGMPSWTMDGSDPLCMVCLCGRDEGIRFGRRWSDADSRRDDAWVWSCPSP